jgi:L-asparaginase
MVRRRIALILTGGTIDTLGRSSLDLAWYTEARQRMGDGELLASCPELIDAAVIEQVPFRRLPSYALEPSDWIELATTVQSLLHDDFEGVVITHGTNTLEETAYFLHLTLASPKPVVLVGAMRPANGLGTEGRLNLLRAVQVASAPQSGGQGVLVVMNDTILAARDVTKTATFRVQALQGRDLGPLGYADADGRIVFYHRHTSSALQTRLFDPAGIAQLPRVDVVVSYVGADGTLIDAAARAGARGIVSAGTGSGRPTPSEGEALDRAVSKGIVVCQSSRVGSGRVPRSPDMRRRRIVAADNLQPWKAKVLLSLALTATSDPDTIQAIFDEG